MAAYKILGQSAPAATTYTDLYTTPSVTSAVISTLVVANRGSSSTTYRIAARQAGATLANQHYIAYDVSISANTTATLTIGIALATTDVLTVYAGNANLTFIAFGVENP